MKEKILALIKKYGLSDHLLDQTPIEEMSTEWNKIIEIACEIEVDEVSKNPNARKLYWVETEEGISNTQEGTDFYYEIEDEVMSYFKIVEQKRGE